MGNVLTLFSGSLKNNMGNVLTLFSGSLKNDMGNVLTLFSGSSGGSLSFMLTGTFHVSRWYFSIYSMNILYKNFYI